LMESTFVPLTKMTVDFQQSAWVYSIVFSVQGFGRWGDLGSNPELPEHESRGQDVSLQASWGANGKKISRHCDFFHDETEESQPRECPDCRSHFGRGFSGLVRSLRLSE
jgi:hypothetical protein